MLARRFDAPHNQKAVMEPVSPGPKPRKWKPGRKVESMEELLPLLRYDARSMVFFNHKPVHGGFVANWSLSLIRTHLGAGRFRRAMVRPEYYTWLQEELDHARENLEF